MGYLGVFFPPNALAHVHTHTPVTLGAISAPLFGRHLPLVMMGTQVG